MNNQQNLQANRWALLRERFLREPLPKKLGELASALASVKSFSDHPAHREVVETFLSEGAHYLDWSVAEVEPVFRNELAELKQLLMEWLKDWQTIWEDVEKRTAVAELAGIWSQKVLEKSGLLQPEYSRETLV
ncbi:MAG: hypothetical protein ACREBD_28965 [Blastocatellia bacterium]